MPVVTIIALPRASQRGLATLAFTLLLLSAMLLAALFVNRNLLIEQHSASNRLRAARAFEAAEAGLEWATAQLNNPWPVGADCQPSNATTATTFRDGLLHIDHSDGLVSLITAADARHADASSPRACRVGDGNAWVCTCSADAAPGLPPLARSGDAAPAFTLDFEGSTHPGVVRVTSTGCAQAGADCAAGGPSQTAPGTISTTVSLALLPGLRTAPSAALTARGSVSFADDVSQEAPTATLPSQPLIHAGGAISGMRRPVPTTEHPELPALFVEHDSGLDAMPADQLFATYFGVGKIQWKLQPGVVRATCAADCTRALRQLVEHRPTPTLVWLDGDADVEGPLALGAPGHPILIVASGALRLYGGVSVHGMLYAERVSWQGASSFGASLRGAIVSESSIAADAMPTLVRDSAALSALQHASGSFVRIAGSWRDF